MLLILSLIILKDLQYLETSNWYVQLKILCFRLMKSFGATEATETNQISEYFIKDEARILVRPISEVMQSFCGSRNIDAYKIFRITPLFRKSLKTD